MSLSLNPTKVAPLLLAMVVALAFSTEARAEISALEFQAKLNAQRAAHGLPSSLPLNYAWSESCRKHNIYSALNGGWDANPHGETPGKPGYTPEGAAAAAQSVLAYGSAWHHHNPWERAPIHLAKLLSPLLASIGFDNSRGYMCAWSHDYDWWHPENRIYTYPGNDTRGIYYAEKTNEWPTSPAAMAGLEDTNDEAAGPYLILMPDGPWLHGSSPLAVEHASLHGPTGGVEIAIIDYRAVSKHRNFFRTRAFLLPVRPLKPNTTYHASVTLSKGSTTLSHSWSFTTGSSTLGVTGPLREQDTTGGEELSGNAQLTQASISHRSFRFAQAAQVKVSYTFSEPAIFFYYTLERRLGKRWVKVRTVQRFASAGQPLSGTQTVSMRRILGSKARPGSYRLKLVCDGGSKRSLTFNLRR